MASAYDWNTGAGADLTLGYNDNFRLASSNKVETFSSTLGVFATLTGTTEISNLRIAVGANANDYSEASIKSSTGYNLSLNAARQEERISSSLGASLASETTTETELLDTGVTVDGTRDSVAISPGLAYQVNERNSASINFNFRDVSYDTVSLTDYSDNSVSLGWSYRLDEVSSLSTGLRHSVYKPEGADSTDTNSVNIGYKWQAAEATNYSFLIGYSEVERPIGSDSGTTDYGIDVSHQADERNRFNLSLGKSVQASGAGEVREQDRLNLQWNHGLSELAQFTLVATGVNTRERDFYSIQAGANYQYDREINLSARYRYREQNSSAATAVYSSTLLFSLSYKAI